MSSKENKQSSQESDVIIQELVRAVSNSNFLMSSSKQTERETNKTMSTFAWGVSQHGQLGMNPHDKSIEGTDVVNIVQCAKMGMWPTESAIRKDIMNVQSPSQTWFPDTIEDIVSISTSFYHTLCADKKGRCYAWGAPFLLGWETRNNQKIPRVLALSQGIKIVQVAAGKYHSIARDATGHVYCWGSTQDGRLGCDKIEDIGKTKFTPFKVNINSKISHVAIGECASFAIGEEHGEVWVWGKNRNCVFGATSEFKKDEIVFTPRVSNVFQKFHVKTLSCPFDHGVALTEDRNVITWGSNHELLGRNSKSYVDTIRPCNVDLNEMGNTDIGYVSASAGRSHSVVLDTQGRLFVWGLTKESHQRMVAAQSPSFKQEYIPDPIQINSYHILARNNDNRIEAKRLEYKSDDPATRIERVAAFCFHTIAVSKDQRVYTWGVDKANRLGRTQNSEDEEWKPHIPSQISLRSKALPLNGAKFQWEIDGNTEDDDDVFGDDDSKSNMEKTQQRTIRVKEITAGEAQSFVVFVLNPSGEFVDDSNIDDGDDNDDDVDSEIVDIDEKEEEEEEHDEKDEKREDSDDSNNDSVGEDSGGCFKKCCCVVS